LSTSETVFLELGVELGTVLIADKLGTGGFLLDLSFVEFAGLGLSLFFTGGDDVVASPSGHLGEVSHSAEVSARLHSQDLEGIGDDDALFAVVGAWHTIEDLQLGEGEGTTGRLVGEHSSEGSPEHSGGSGEMLEAASGVGVNASVFSGFPVKVVSEERS